MPTNINKKKKKKTNERIGKVRNAAEFQQHKLPAKPSKRKQQNEECSVEPAVERLDVISGEAGGGGGLQST